MGQNLYYVHTVDNHGVIDDFFTIDMHTVNAIRTKIHLPLMLLVRGHKWRC